jgi:hypothetical protein
VTTSTPPSPHSSRHSRHARRATAASVTTATPIQSRVYSLCARPPSVASPTTRVMPLRPPGCATARLTGRRRVAPISCVRRSSAR